MEFLAEFLVERLGEVIIEAGTDAAANHRVPKWLRVLVLIALGLLFAAVLAILVIVGIAAFSELPLISVLLFALSAAWIFLGVRKFRRILRTFSRQ